MDPDCTRSGLYPYPVDYGLVEVAMTSRINVKLPEEIKAKLDCVYRQHRASSSEARWHTVNQAIDKLAESKGYDVDPEGDDSSGRRRFRR